ncbi:MAG: ATP phosphoribosyltransferase regulatory subunit, partial [Eggerthellaceae bacterium]|nr:ATP phosphoribosyltransferase regulatory subunit [Eggerthellaceae bacterium]
MNLTTPQGFRDVLPNEAAVRERIIADVQKLFSEHGYLPIETPTLEVMDVMSQGGHLPGSPFKFFDSEGELLAMRPDVTVQVARMCASRYAKVEGPLKFRYTQRVFREKATDAQELRREVTQVGIESIGQKGPDADAEIISLFAQALSTADVKDFLIALATV